MLSIEECMDVLSNAGKNEAYVGEIVHMLHSRPTHRLRKLATMAYHGASLVASQSHGHVIVNGQSRTWQEVDKM
jgi:hypothetical protein